MQRTSAAGLSSPTASARESQLYPTPRAPDPDPASTSRSVPSSPKVAARSWRVAARMCFPWKVSPPVPDSGPRVPVQGVTQLHPVLYSPEKASLLQ
jgi:hypothetical protein